MDIIKMDHELIQWFIIECQVEVYGDIAECFEENDIEYIKELGFDVEKIRSFVDKYSDFNLSVHSEGYHRTDSDYCDYTVILKNLKTGEKYVGTDNHNLIFGWNELELQKVK